MDYIDPLERRDYWRTVWSILTHDALFAAALVLVSLGIVTLTWLPQSPSDADSFTVNQWRAETQLRLGDSFDPLDALGLINMRSAPWLRIAAVALCALAGARLIDRCARLIGARRPDWPLTDEVRARVTDQAPSFERLQEALRARHYTVQGNGDVLRATRAPRAELLSGLLQLGALLASAGLLLNIALGWDVSGQSLAPDTPAVLRDDTTLTLRSEDSSNESAGLTLDPGNTRATLAPAQAMSAGGTRVELRQIARGYRISAAGGDGAPLSIRTSNYLSPTTDARVSFGNERVTSIAVPDAQIVLTLAQADSGSRDRVLAYSVGSAAVIADAPLQPSMIISGTTFSFAPSVNATVDAQHRPGSAVSWLGLALALAGLIGTALLPMRRMIVRHHGHWTEIYAGGRNVRRDVRAILITPEAPTRDI